MNKIKIPKRFKIFGQTFTVEFVYNLVQGWDHIGEAIFRNNKILIQKNCKGIARTHEQIEQVFLHEMIHILFNELREDIMRDNDPLIDKIASALHQVFQTAEY
jgi:hypothetical protein